MEFIKFSSIEQFRGAIKAVNDSAKWNNTPLPTLTFTGTTKIHGTNACISYDVATEEFQYQSRERVLSLTSDNAGFMMWASQDNVKRNIIDIAKHLSVKESIYVYGEWAGKGVQPKVGVSNLDKKFYVFSIIVDGVECLTPDTPIREIVLCLGYIRDIYNIHEFGTYTVKVDFNNPEIAQNKFVELTLAVEAECPVAKYFLSSGPNYADMNKTGEGLVWRNIETGLKFKTKGEKHSNSKVKTIKEIAAVDIIKMNNLQEFIGNVVTDNRLDQGLTVLREAGLDSTDPKNLGTFIKWVFNDVVKEENDTIIGNQFDTKHVGQQVSRVARTFYFNQELL